MSDLLAEMLAKENPLREGLSSARAAERCVLVIVGATGDLTARKLMPALFSLHCDGLLPRGFSVVGTARHPIGDEEFRKRMREGVAQFSRYGGAIDTAWEDFAAGLFFQACDETAEGYAALGARLDVIAAGREAGPNRVYYLAIPPSAAPAVVEHLGAAGLINEGGKAPPWTRIIIEKPFGRDLDTARTLNASVSRVFDEDQVYRIDHYLGKETVQNILALRFANGLFEPVWNRNYIDHVQITVAETVGVEGRAAYFEEAGILRDIVQNHMLELLALTAMEPPITFEADAVRDEKVKVLSALRLPSRDDIARRIVRAQYGSGSLGNSQVPGYREEPGVAADSLSETYVALPAYVDSWRWAGVPFYLRAGKRLAKRVTEIAIQFRTVPLQLFARAGAEIPAPSVLSMHIQPNEGITLQFNAKVPGPTIRLQPVNMDFRYGTSFGEATPDAYERLLLDVLIGDSTLFTRRDEVEAAWTFVTAILDGWNAVRPGALPTYAAGTWGPAESDALLATSGRNWRRL